MNTPEWLRAHKDPSLTEADDPPAAGGDKKDKKDKKDKGDKKPDKKDREPKKPEKPKRDEPEPPISDIPPEADTGLETGIEPPPGEEPPPGPPEAPKSGEEIPLKQLTQNKPIKDIKVSTDDAGGHVSLTLGGLEAPVEIHVARDGKATFELGELSRTLVTGPSRKQGTAEV